MQGREVVCRYHVPTQQHFYMETQVSVAEPQEGGTMLIHSSTQSLDGIQVAVAKALGKPANDIIAGTSLSHHSLIFNLPNPGIWLLPGGDGSLDKLDTPCFIIWAHLLNQDFTLPIASQHQNTASWCFVQRRPTLQTFAIFSSSGRAQNVSLANQTDSSSLLRATSLHFCLAA